MRRSPTRVATLLVAGGALIAVIGVGIGAQQSGAPQPGAAAQTGEPGSGAAAPNKLGQPLPDPHGFVRNDSMLRAPALLPGDRKYADLGQGQAVKVSFKMTSEMRSGLKTASVLGTLPGATDEDITIFAHMDGPFRAALDNAS